MTKLHRILWLPLFVATAWLVAAPNAEAQTGDRLYSVKFICGQTEGRVLAPGDYTTAINIQNPNHDPNSAPVQFRKRYSVALPGETVGGVTDFLDGKELGPGEAFEIDCPDILEVVREFCSSGFCKGFATLEASAELEVVAVYSAAGRETQSVEALHTERVSTAQRCPVRSVELPQRDILFIPRHVRGDREFDGHGPCVRFDFDLRTHDAGTTLSAEYQMHAYECSSFNSPQHDFTAAEETRRTVLLSAGPGSRITGYSVQNSLSESYRDTDHADDLFPYAGSEPILLLRFVGDTGGDEAGTKTGVQMTLRPMRVTLEDCSSVAKKEG